VTKTVGWEQDEQPEDRNVKPRFDQISFGSKRYMGMENIEFRIDNPLSDSLKEYARVKEEYPDNILIVSFMSDMGKERWQELAKRCASTGADMLELNLSCPHGMPEQGMGAAIGQDPITTAKVVNWVTEAVSIPVLVKLTPNITDMRLVARAAVNSGAAGISAINTVKSILGVDLDTFSPKPSVAGQSAYGGLSGPAIKPIALRFVAELASDPLINRPVSGIGGICTWNDAVEFLLLGATTVQVSTWVMRFGYRIISDLVEGLVDYMRQKGFSRIDQLIGISLEKLKPIRDLSRDYNIVADFVREECVGCGLCYIACRDGGFQAIDFSIDRLPEFDEQKCEGCGLCYGVCPVNCIVMKEPTATELER
jgi:dihydropyrimidine dehydrogenase (NAD+) subunit PreA